MREREDDIHYYTGLLGLGFKSHALGQLTVLWWFYFTYQVGDTKLKALKCFCVGALA